MHLRNGVITGIGFFILQQAAALEKEDINCHLGEPSIREETAAILLDKLHHPSPLLKSADEGSPSVQLQLLLWAFIQNDEIYRPYVKQLDLNKLIGRKDDPVSGLLWLIASSPLHRRAIPEIEKHLDFLDSWASGFIKTHPRKMFLLLTAAEGIAGTKMVSRKELEYIDTRITDPEIAFDIAGKLQQEEKYIYAHEKFIDSIESGSVKAILGLGILEKNVFKECESRGDFYIRLAVAFWGKAIPPQMAIES